MDAMGRSWLLLLAATLGLACGGSGSLPDSIIDKQADDPCDPGSSSTKTGSQPAVDAGATPVSLPGGSAGIGFDDLRFSATLAQILVPAGRTGDLDFLDPSTEALTETSGFSSDPTYSGDTSFGVTSADEGNRIVYVTDRTASTLTVVDGQTRAVVTSVMLASTPGYVRYVAPTKEVWVTEPKTNQVEVFTLGTVETMPPVHSMFISAGGVESLEVDAVNGLAFTNGTSSTYTIDVAKHAVSATAPNGCTTARGIAIDSTNGWVMVACQEGRVVVLGEQSGAMLGTVATGAGVDRMAYDSMRARLYVPSPAASAMAVVGMGSQGVPAILGSVDVLNDSHCAVTSGGGQIYVCSPTKGQLLLVNDPF
jgi:hypothetical protein